MLMFSYPDSATCNECFGGHCGPWIKLVQFDNLNEACCLSLDFGRTVHKKINFIHLKINWTLWIIFHSCVVPNAKLFQNWETKCCSLHRPKILFYIWVLMSSFPLLAALLHSHGWLIWFLKRLIPPSKMLCCFQKKVISQWCYLSSPIIINIDQCQRCRDRLVPRSAVTPLV